MKIGAIFDWDGVIIDSSAFHEKSWELLAREEKLDLPEDHFKKGFGRKNQYIIPNILKWTDDTDEVERLGDRKEALYRESLSADELEGRGELIRYAREEVVQIKSGCLAAGISEISGAPDDSARARILEPCQQDLAAAIKIVLLVHHREIRAVTWSQSPPPAVVLAYNVRVGHAGITKRRGSADSTFDVERYAPQCAHGSDVESTEINKNT